MMRHSFLSLLAAGSATFATGCSSPQGSSVAAAPESAAKPVVAERGPGTRADSLGGIPGHKFGGPLSAFPGLKLLPAAQQQPGYKTYAYPEGKGEPGWFGKRIRETPGSYLSLYRFRDGRFVSFAAKAFGLARPPPDEQASYPVRARHAAPGWHGHQLAGPAGVRRNRQRLQSGVRRWRVAPRG